MDVSIIVPFRADCGALERCVDALRAARHAGGVRELILVGHGTQADEAGIVRTLDGVRVLQVQHPSAYAARNLGARHAQGEVLLFTEAHCVVEPDWIEQHLAALAGSHASISVGPVAPARHTRLLDQFLAYETVRDRNLFASAYWKHYFGRPSNMATTRERFASHGPFDEVMRGADSAFVQRVTRGLSCDEVVYAENAVVRHVGLRGMPSLLRQRAEFSYLMNVHASSHSAPLSFKERWTHFSTTVRNERYGPARAIALLSMIAIGNAAFKSGRWLAVLKGTRTRRKEPQSRAS